MTEPTTVAGRAMTERYLPKDEGGLGIVPTRRQMGKRLAAIEREAINAERARLRAAVEVLPQPTLGLAGGVNRAAVLALLEPEP